MGKFTTIKVSKKTLKKLHKLAGELAQKRGERVTLEEAIIEILIEHKNRKNSNKKDTQRIKKDRESLLSLLSTKVDGAGPEDFLEYDFKDIGGKSESE